MDIVQKTYHAHLVGGRALAVDRAYTESYRRWCQHYLATPAMHIRNGNGELVAPDARPWSLADRLGHLDSAAAAIWAQVRRERSRELARELRPQGGAP